MPCGGRSSVQTMIVGHQGATAGSGGALGRFFHLRRAEQNGRVIDEPEAATVTVIIGCFNHERFVEQAIRAVADQDFDDLFLIVFDDKSSDRSVEIIERCLAEVALPSLFLRHENNVGLCRSLNDAIDHTRSTYLIVQSADDWLDPDAVRRRVAAIESAPETTALCYGDAKMTDEGGRPRADTFLDGRLAGRVPPEGDVIVPLVEGNFILPLTAIIRRSAMLSVGLYDERLMVEDFDMWLRIATRFPVTYTGNCDANYRVLPDSLTTAVFRDRRDRARAEGVTMLKHCLNLSEELDRAVIRAIRRVTLIRYWDGTQARALAADMRLICRYDRSLETQLYRISMRLGISGSLVSAVRRALIRIGVRRRATRAEGQTI